MKLIRGLFSLISCLLTVFGAIIFLVSFVNKDLSTGAVKGLSFAMFIVGISIAVVFSLIKSKTVSGTNIFYFLINGFIVLMYITVVFIPLGIVIRNLLGNAFFEWKESE